MKKIKLHRYLIVGTVLWLGHAIFSGQLDFTSDQRYSLSETAVNTLEEDRTPLRIDVFLGGTLPSDFQRLRRETETLLKQMERHRTLDVSFIDPFESDDNVTAIVEEMLQFGLPPHNVVAANSQSVAQTVVFPWALVSNGNRSVRVALLKNNLGDRAEQTLLRSIRQLEYQFIDAVLQLQTTTKKSIAVLTSHGTSSAATTADLLQSLKTYYNLAAFDLKALENNPLTTLSNLKRFDALLISNPQEAFSTEEKLLLDQYQMHGGASLWAINPIKINRDSLFNRSGQALAFPNDLNLEDFFFKRGLRINTTLISDMYCAPIVLAQGEGNQSQYLPYPWKYYPLINALENNSLNAGVGTVWMRFASTIDTLKNNVNKQIVLQSSPLSKALEAPFLVRLEEATQPLNPDLFDEKNLTTAVLLEGEFESVFNNRIIPVDSLSFTSKGNAKMLVIADGNLAENQLDKGQPLELGYDKWTNNFYNNKNFLLNAFHYLMGEEERIKLRAKELEIAFLDAQKVKEKASYIQVVVTLIPLLFLALSALGIRLWRRRLLH